ncbi:hypothetical protein V2J09_001547 [Rumex salicifolius]
MGRSPCCEKAHTNKGAWTKDEDQRLVDYIRRHGEGCWRSLPKAAGLLRCGKSCRLRWINYLRPDLKRGNFTDEEDELIIKLHSLLGNKWSLIAARLPGRTDNEIKNYWNTHIKRKLLSRGVDPQTHRPLDSGAGATVNAATKKPKLELKTEPNLPLCEIDFNKPNWGVIKSSESSTVESGTTSSVNAGKLIPQDMDYRIGEEEIELDLSLGLAPFRSKIDALTGQPPARILPVASSPPAKGVCLCCQLGFQNGQICSNCQASGAYSNMGNFYYYRSCIGPLGS